MMLLHSAIIGILLYIFMVFILGQNENVAENRGNHFRRNSGGQAGGIDARYAEAFQSVYPRTVFSL